jgi:hypothetical protein
MRAMWNSGGAMGESDACDMPQPSAFRPSKSRNVTPRDDVTNCEQICLVRVTGRT